MTPIDTAKAIGARLLQYPGDGAMLAGPLLLAALKDEAAGVSGPAVTSLLASLRKEAGIETRPGG
jgi:hypothetical protein